MIIVTIMVSGDTFSVSSSNFVSWTGATQDAKIDLARAYSSSEHFVKTNSTIKSSYLL